MAKTDASQTTPTDAPISIVGAGMTMEGDSETDGSLRIDGTIRGDVRAGESVVIGKDGLVEGSIYTPQAVIAVVGAVYAELHLELQATSRISGEIQAGQMRVEDGAMFQGQVAVGKGSVKIAPKPGSGPSSEDAEGQASDGGTQGPSSS